MNKQEFAALLITGAAEMEVALSPRMTEKLLHFKELLLAKNKSVNLTAITEDGEFLVKHFLDSLSAARFVPCDARLLDVGTGAGFPGIPLKIARPDIDVTLLDSTRKKLAFIDEAAAAVGVDITTLHTRAEAAGRCASYREAFDVVISRAVADMPLLSELCLPLLRVGGVFIAMRSKLQDEGNTANRQIISFNLPHADIFGEEIGRTLIITKKVRPTPSKFPRNTAELAKIYKKDV